MSKSTPIERRYPDAEPSGFPPVLHRWLGYLIKRNAITSQIMNMLIFFEWMNLPPTRCDECLGLAGGCLWPSSVYSSSGH
jgi:hypothetical protein